MCWSAFFSLLYSLLYSSLLKRDSNNLKQSGFCATYSFNIIVSEPKYKNNLKNRELKKIYTFYNSGQIALVRQEYKIHNQFPENCYWLVIGDSKKKAFVQVCPTFLSYYLLSHNLNILETLNLVLTLSSIYLFLAFSEDHRPYFDTNPSVTPLLAAAEAPPARRLCKPYFSGFAVISVI